MSRLKTRDVIEKSLKKYNEEFLSTLSLKNVASIKDFKALATELKKANEFVTEYYMMLYNDFITALNNKNMLNYYSDNIEALKRYKSLASKIQKAYNYISSLYQFENPFKVTKKV